MLFERTPAKAPELNGRQRLSIIALDVALLAEVTVSVYMASRDPELFTPVFMKVFFSMALPTLIAGIYAIRRFRSRAPEVEA